MSQIAHECNEIPPLKVYNTLGRWRIVKSIHVDNGEEITQYALQRYSSRKGGKVIWHLVAFFWSIEDFEDFIDFLNISADRIEEIDGEHILRRKEAHKLRGA